MSRIEDLRASIEHRIDALEHQATALESQLMQTKEEAIQRLEQGKQQLRDVVTALQTELRTSKAVVDVAKAELQARLDHLRVQLALGKAEAHETLEQPREKIFKALSEFESVADQKLAETAFESGRLWESLVGRASRLEAEFEALTHRLLIESGQQRHMVEEKKQELLQRIWAYQDDLRRKRQMVRARADTFEIDLREGLVQIKTAFQRLFD
jgi:hypothetical protein